MKKILTMAVMASLIGCTAVSPEPGTIAVLHDKPFVFGSGGVRSEIIHPGLTYTWLSTQAIYVPSTPQTIPIDFDDLVSGDNILLDFSANVQYQINDAPELVKNFGMDWFRNNVETQYREIVRNTVRKYQMTAIMSGDGISQLIDDEILANIQALIASQNIPIRIINVSLGRAKPNSEVLEQMNLTASQQQRAKTMIEATKAELQREKEQSARAKADDAYRREMGLSPSQYLELQLAEINKDACVAAKTCVIAPKGTSVIVQ